MGRCCVVDVVITTSVQSMGSKDWNGVTLENEGGVGPSDVRLGWMGLLVVLMVVVLLVVVAIVSKSLKALSVLLRTLVISDGVVVVGV
jgi:hypothetical protein